MNIKPQSSINNNNNTAFNSSTALSIFASEREAITHLPPSSTIPEYNNNNIATIHNNI